MQSNDKPKKLSPGAIAGAAAAEKIVREREEEQEHQAEVLRVRRETELAAAKSSESADIRYLGEHLSRIVTLLESINVRLVKIERRISGKGRGKNPL